MTDQRELMQAVASGLDDVLNGPANPGLPRQRKVGFALLLYPFGEADDRVNYVGNGPRPDVQKAMRSWLRQGAEGAGTAEPHPGEPQTLLDAAERVEWWLSTLHAGEPTPDPAKVIGLLRRAIEREWKRQ